MVEAEAASGVDVLHRRDTLAQGEHRLVDHRHQYAVDDEARRVVGMDDFLAETTAKGFDRLQRRIARGKAADQFDQAHHRDRIEEMDTDEARRIGRGLREAGDRDRAGVAGEDRGIRQVLADAGKDRALDFLALGRRFDDKLGGGEGGYGRQRA